MTWNRYRNSSSDDAEVSFPRLECWNPMTNVATIAAQVTGRRVLCRISLGVLQKKFGASSEEPMQAIVDNRPVIEAAARKLIENASFEEDGNIVIRQKDI